MLNRRLTGRWRVGIEREDPRQYVDLVPRRRFDRACRKHRLALIADSDADTLTCPAGHRVRSWLLMEITERRLAATVTDAAVSWSRWYRDAYPSVVTVAGRNRAGYAPKRKPPVAMNSLPGWKQEAHRLRNAGWEPYEARVEARLRVLERIRDAAESLAVPA